MPHLRVESARLAVGVVSPAKTSAQWRRQAPAYDRAVRVVEALRESWSGGPLVVAHIHPDTHVVSIILHGDRSDTANADRRLRGYHAGGWVQETTCGVTVWRKVVHR